MEYQLNHKTKPSLISQKSSKILINKQLREFDEAMKSVEQLYPSFSNNQGELTEEQFVALFYNIGIFNDIGRREEY